METVRKKAAASIGAVLLVLAGWVIAQDVAADLQLGSDPRWGDHVVTGDGFSVYLYVLDEDGASACVDSCLRNWPPVTVDAGTEPVLGEGLDPELVGTLERADGTLQLTYGGHPLYTNRRDTEVGHTRGQALGDQFYLVSPAGESVTEELDAEVVEVSEEEMAALMSEGRLVFTSNCAVCHGAEGQGGVGPAFAGNGLLSDGDYVVDRVLIGFIDHGMPPFAGVLNDRQIAAVTTFIRNSWGNEFGPVLEEHVAEQR